MAASNHPPFALIWLLASNVSVAHGFSIDTNHAETKGHIFKPAVSCTPVVLGSESCSCRRAKLPVTTSHIVQIAAICRQNFRGVFGSSNTFDVTFMVVASLKPGCERKSIPVGTSGDLGPSCFYWSSTFSTRPLRKVSWIWWSRMYLESMNYCALMFSKFIKSNIKNKPLSPLLFVLNVSYLRR